MPFRWDPHEHFRLIRYALKWFLIATPLGVLVGSAVALFLWALERATEIRWSTDTRIGLPWLLFLLPLGGVAIGWLYQAFGKSVEAGNNLIMDEIYQPGGGVPSRMAPLVLIGTVATHLFGGSGPVGRGRPFRWAEASRVNWADDLNSMQLIQKPC